MPDQPYFYSAPDLRSIITKTNDAISEMNTVNNMVQSHTDALVDANRSDSGQILSQHLATWNSDFHTCVNNLTELNNKAQALLNINNSTNLNTTGMAK
jgi:L-ribulose-5-phosphate 3-epimerase UlaE